MSERDLAHLLERTVKRLQRVFYVIDFMLDNWDYISIDNKHQLLELIRHDIANFEVPLENWRVFQEGEIK